MIKNYNKNMLKKYTDYINECINESKNTSANKFDKKYYDVKFNKDTLINKVFIGENKYISVLAKKDDILRLYIDRNKTNNNVLSIKGISPISDKEPIFKSAMVKTVNVNNLWNANFIVENNNFNINNLPFTFI